MFFLSNLCILCVNNYKNLRTVLIEDNEGILIQTKLKFCLPEIFVNSNLDIPQHICINCMSKLDCFYKFKQWCLQNNTHLKSYLQTLTFADDTHKHLSVKLTDTKNQHEQQTETLPVIESDDELRIREIEDNWTSEEAEASVENEFKSADVSDNEELYPLLHEEKEIDVKKECPTSEDNCENEFYNKYVKCEPSPIDCDVSLSDSEEEEAVVKHDFKCADVSDNNKSHSFLDDDKEIIVKQESLTSEANGDLELYHKYVKSIKCESVQSDSDVSVSSNEVVNEDSEYSYCSSEKMAIKPQEYNVIVENIIKIFNKFKCAICSREFLYKASLIYHLKVHAGIKDYTCSICDKKFRHPANLINHKKIHTGDTNLECPICKKKFTYKCNLVRHERNHLGVKNFECSICKKKFARNENMVRHKRIHTETLNRGTYNSFRGSSK